MEEPRSFHIKLRGPVNTPILHLRRVRAGDHAAILVQLGDGLPNVLTLHCIKAASWRHDEDGRYAVIIHFLFSDSVLEVRSLYKEQARQFLDLLPRLLDGSFSATPDEPDFAITLPPRA
jgi:hypothetical protein